MGEVPLSLHIDAGISRRLEEEARLQSVSTEDLASQAIQSYLKEQEQERQILRRLAVEADKGIFVSEEAMMHWMDQLEDDIDAPAPAPDVFVKQT